MLTSSSLIPNDIHGNKPWKLQKVELSYVISGRLSVLCFATNFFDQFETNLLQNLYYRVVYLSPRIIFLINKNQMYYQRRQRMVRIILSSLFDSISLILSLWHSISIALNLLWYVLEPERREKSHEILMNFIKKTLRKIIYRLTGNLFST